MMSPPINDIEQDRQAILNGDLEAVIHRNALLDIMLYMGTVIGQHLDNMRWALIETDSEYPFITSDMIINCYNPNISESSYFSPSLGSYESTLFVPISNRLTLMMINREDFVDGQIFTLNEPRYTSSGKRVNVKKLIKLLNKTVFIKSYEFVFASTNSDKLKKMFANVLNEAKFLTSHSSDSDIE